jgi:hypothetical protein
VCAAGHLAASVLFECDGQLDGRRTLILKDILAVPSFFGAFAFKIFSFNPAGFVDAEE